MRILTVILLLQVVAGVNYHVTMNATDAVTGNKVLAHAVVHRNLHGEHSSLYASTTTVQGATASNTGHFDTLSWILLVSGFVVGAVGGALMCQAMKRQNV